MKKILIVDDNAAVLEALSLLLEIHGYQTERGVTNRKLSGD